MERIIKFRAWDGLYGKMFYGDEPKAPSSSSFFHAVEQRPKEQTPPVMQFTGLHDKNGKEIYEGDVVKVVTKDFDMPDAIDTGVVKFTRGHWQVNSKEDSYYLYGQDELEVIGNIYEHPELLTDSNAQSPKATQ